MAKDRIEPCKHYVCLHVCVKGREAKHNGYCQRCNKYEPRVEQRHLNQKKQKLDKIKQKDFD